MIPPLPPAADWATYRSHMAQFSNPSGQRGRIFSRNIGVADTDASEFFASAMVAAEEAFRRERSIPEIGRGWVSEVATIALAMRRSALCSHGTASGCSNGDTMCQLREPP